VAVPLETCSHEDVCSVFGFYGRNKFLPIIVHCQLIVYGNGVMRVQHVIKWWKDLKNGQMTIHDDECAG